MKWWPLIGIKDYFTEKELSETDIRITPLKNRSFQKSLFVFVIDCGNSNLLNFTIRALKSPHYNTHRFGIYFTETPRHADLLIVLGPLNEEMKAPLLETVSQLPDEFGILLISEESPLEDELNNLNLPNVVGSINKDISPDELLTILLKIMGKIL